MSQAARPIGLLIKGRDLANGLRRAAFEDAAALPLLDPTGRQRLLATVRSLPYRPCKPTVGEGERLVRQRFSLCMEIPAGHAVRRLGHALDRLFADARAALPADFAELAGFNDFIVQRYEPGAVGITPHRDHVRYTGVVAVVVLSGRARFCVCRDRVGTGAREIGCPPGGVILMRAPGMVRYTASREPMQRPFHFVADIRRRRYTIGLRHDSADETRGPG
jgi:hypothetical protein